MTGPIILPVTEVQAGDVVTVKGVMLHDDLAGLTFENRVVRVEPTADGRTFLHWDNGSKTWWTNTEKVQVHR